MLVVLLEDVEELRVSVMFVVFEVSVVFVEFSWSVEFVVLAVVFVELRSSVLLDVFVVLD